MERSSSVELGTSSNVYVQNNWSGGDPSTVFRSLPVSPICSTDESESANKGAESAHGEQRKFCFSFVPNPVGAAGVFVTESLLSLVATLISFYEIAGGATGDHLFWCAGTLLTAAITELMSSLLLYGTITVKSSLACGYLLWKPLQNVTVLLFSAIHYVGPARIVSYFYASIFGSVYFVLGWFFVYVAFCCRSSFGEICPGRSENVDLFDVTVPPEEDFYSSTQFQLTKLQRTNPRMHVEQGGSTKLSAIMQLPRTHHVQL